MESKGAKDSGGGSDDAKGSEAKGSSQPAAAESKHQRGGGGDAKATSEVVAYAREVHQTFMVHADTDYNGVNAEGHPWKLSTRKPELGDLEIYYSKVTGSKYSRWHSVCVLPHPVDEVYPAILDVQHRLTWDRGLEGHESVAVTAQGTDVPTRDGSVAVQVSNLPLPSRLTAPHISHTCVHFTTPPSGSYPRPWVPWRRATRA